MSNNIEEDIKIIKDNLFNIQKDICLQLRISIENALADRERYKRLAEKNLNDNEEFKNNMCNHRCIRNSEIVELQKELNEENNRCAKFAVENNELHAKTNKYDNLMEKIENILQESSKKEVSDAYRYDELYGDLFNSIKELQEDK